MEGMLHKGNISIELLHHAIAVSSRKLYIIVDVLVRVMLV